LADRGAADKRGLRYAEPVRCPPGKHLLSNERAPCNTSFARFTTVSIVVGKDSILVHALTAEGADGLAGGEMDRRATRMEGAA